MKLEAVLEGLLFLTGDEGITSEKAEEILEINQNQLKDLVEKISHQYETDNHGIHLEVLGNRLKLVTKKEYHEYYERLVIVEKAETLSTAALETLAIIAYNQPVTRIQIDEIRGVSSIHMVHRLLLKEMIEEVGRSELPGRPILYGTTPTFLDYFGLSDLKDLPKMEEPNKIEEETNLFESKYKEIDSK